MRVTNTATGKSVVVRVNDRGPFLHGRIIDLSYAAAHRIGIAAKGSGEVEVEAIIPGESPVLVAQAPLPAVAGGVASAARPSRWRRRPRGAMARAASPCSWARSRTTTTRRSFLAHVQGQLAAAQVEPKVREVNGLYRVFVGPYPDRDEARRVAERITGAFGMATAIAPH